MRHTIGKIISCNPVVGCTRGCVYCYAKQCFTRYYPEARANRWKFDKPRYFPERLEMFQKKKPTIFFCTSMSDLAEWKPKWRAEINSAMRDNPQHVYIGLTKRPESDNVCLSDSMITGVTITRQQDVERMNVLTQDGKLGGYFYTWICLEPLHGPIDLSPIKELDTVDWVAIGKETGSRQLRYTPQRDDILRIVEQCKQLDIPVAMKQSIHKIVGDENFIQEYPRLFTEIWGET